MMMTTMKTITMVSHAARFFFFLDFLAIVSLGLGSLALLLHHLPLHHHFQHHAFHHTTHHQLAHQTTEGVMMESWVHVRMMRMSREAKASTSNRRHGHHARIGVRMRMRI